MMKKAIASMSVLALTFSLYSCGGGSSSEEEADSTALSEEVIEEVIREDSVSRQVEQEVDSLESTADRILNDLNQN